jgi:outer membrane usher protein
MQTLRQSGTIPFYSGKMSPVAIIFISMFSVSGSQAETQVKSPQSIASNVEFDPLFLKMANSNEMDLSRFANGSNVLPGHYKVAIYLNGAALLNADVEFKSREEKTVYPCLTPQIVVAIDFNTDRIPASLLKAIKGGEQCIDLTQEIPDAQVMFDTNEQRLDILLPQAYVNTLARGSVNPALWDSGVPALLLGYNVNAYSSQSNGNDSKSLYASINSGLNVGAWYLRHNGAYNWADAGEKKYTTLNTYMQRDIPVLQGRALIGESNTNGLIFDTLPFSGVQLSSDERMLPASLRGYAPDIRGIARTAARVTVSQGGQVIYERTVSPGEFIINDLYPTGYGGNLDVTIHEADGSEQNFTVPFASVAQLLRPGTHRYSVTLGKLRNDFITNDPALYQATYQRGLTNTVTGYGGLQASQDYYSLQLGAALGTVVGALSADVTQSRTHLPANSGGTQSGQSYQLGYSKVISETNSSLSLAAYRFSTAGYMDYLTAMNTREVVRQGFPASSVGRAKNRVTLTAGQGLPGNWGQFYISSSVQNYWNREGNDTQYQMGYNNRYKSLSYGLSVNRSQSAYGSTQNNYLLSFSFPLGRSDTGHTPNMRVQLNRDSNGNMREQTTLSGTTGTDNQFSYNASAMNSNNGGGASGALNAQYRSQATAMSASYGAGRNYQSQGLGINGTMVAHPGGVTLTPYTGETFAVVEAKGAEGASVSSYPGVRIDSRGYAVVPYLNPYQMNDISIDPKGTSSNVELDNTAQKVAPHAGAVVMLKYTTKKGWPVLINATFEDQPVPFGASVQDEKGNNIGAVGQGGQIYARVSSERGKLNVVWGDGSQMACQVGYVLMPQPKGHKATEIQTFTSRCQVVSDTQKPTQLAEIKPGALHSES